MEAPLAAAGPHAWSQPSSGASPQLWLVAHPGSGELLPGQVCELVEREAQEAAGPGIHLQLTNSRPGTVALKTSAPAERAQQDVS